MRIRSLASATLLAVVTALPAAAQQINDVDGTYVSTTNQIAINPLIAEFDDFGSVSFAGFTLASSELMNKREVGTGWQTWSQNSPNSEWDGTAPFFVGAIGTGSTTFTMNSKVSIFGFEAESDEETMHTFTVNYFSGANLVGSISRAIDGNAGSRLLGWEFAPGFDRAVVTVDDGGFAVGQFRVQVANPTTTTPEPATLALLATGLGLVGVVARRRATA